MDTALHNRAETKSQVHGHHQHHRLAGAGLDLVGLSLSSLCVVHCLATPLLVTLLPFTAVWGNPHHFHLWLALVLIPLGSIAFWRGFMKHGSLAILASGGLGLILVMAGTLLHKTHSVFSLTLLGSAVLISSHWRNWRAGRCQTCAQG
jgi:hypothetical protein